MAFPSAIVSTAGPASLLISSLHISAFDVVARCVTAEVSACRASDFLYPSVVDLCPIAARDPIDLRAQIARLLVKRTNVAERGLIARKTRFPATNDCRSSRPMKDSPREATFRGSSMTPVYEYRTPGAATDRGNSACKNQTPGCRWPYRRSRPLVRRIADLDQNTDAALSGPWGDRRRRAGFRKDQPASPASCEMRSATIRQVCQRRRSMRTADHPCPREHRRRPCQCRP